MRNAIYWIEGSWLGRLGIVPRPRGDDWLEEDVRSWHESGLDVILSLLTRDEVNDFDLVEEETLCRKHGLQFLSFPIVDLSVPSSRTATLDCVRLLDDALAKGKAVGIHCRQGIGRSSLLAACVLVYSGVDTETAFQRVSIARGLPVPETDEQRHWVGEFTRRFSPKVKVQ